MKITDCINGSLKNVAAGATPGSEISFRPSFVLFLLCLCQLCWPLYAQDNSSVSEITKVSTASRSAVAPETMTGKFPANQDSQNKLVPLTLAVEFTSHAASAYVALKKGWFVDAGLQISKFDCYVTGTALSAALARGEIDMALMCLAPAINAYKNGKIPLKVVAGLHQYGYGLLVNPKKIRSIEDLKSGNIILSCVNEGSASDVVFNKVFAKMQLPAQEIMSRARRMPPPKAFMALETGVVDGIICPEHFVSQGKERGFVALIGMADLQKCWPDLQGSVVIVSEKFLEQNPEAVKAFVAVIARSIDYLNNEPAESGKILAGVFSEKQDEIFPREIIDTCKQVKADEKAFENSITGGMINTIQLDVKSVQEMIDYMSELGYVSGFKAEQIVDKRFMPDAAR